MLTEMGEPEQVVGSVFDKSGLFRLLCYVAIVLSIILVSYKLWKEVYESGEAFDTRTGVQTPRFVPSPEVQLIRSMTPDYMVDRVRCDDNMRCYTEREALGYANSV